MRLIQGIGKRAWKMDCCIWQKTYGLYFPWPRRRASSSDDGPANEPSAEILGCRGGARSQEVRKRIFTTDEGSPHLEWHRRYRGRPHEDRVNGEISTHRQKVRPDRNFSSLRYLTPLVRGGRDCACENAVVRRTDRMDLPSDRDDQSAFDAAAQISLLGKLKLTNCALSTLRPAHAIGKIETSLALPRPTHLCSQATDYSLTLCQSKPATVCPRRVLVAIRRWMLDGA